MAANAITPTAEAGLPTLGAGLPLRRPVWKFGRTEVSVECKKIHYFIGPAQTFEAGYVSIRYITQSVCNRTNTGTSQVGVPIGLPILS